MVFFDYDDSLPAAVRFKVSNGNELMLHFPSETECYLICSTKRSLVTSTTSFRREFDLSIGFVPILGPVEHDEALYQKEAARLALLGYRAARNFRNIWYHYPDDFHDFRAMIRTTWPGMDIERPELDITHGKPILRMFCPEERIPREIFWAGFGFQVWCQMLTYIVRNREAAVFVIDEPDIYLHSDLQRQLLSILKTLGPDILIATHSTELIAEADPGDLIVINKKTRSAKRIKDPTRMQEIFSTLGSNLNPVLTQLAKTRRVVFVEGKDFQILARFARKLRFERVANRTDFAVIPAGGFNPAKVRDFKEGMETTLGSRVIAGVIFDRDYRSDAECAKESSALLKQCKMVHIHSRKELENFVLEVAPLERAIERRIKERERRTGEIVRIDRTVSQLLEDVTYPMRNRIQAQYLSRRRPFEKATHRGLDDTTIDERLMTEFDASWVHLDVRLGLVPGREVLGELNKVLQDQCKVTVSVALIIDCFEVSDIPGEMRDLIEAIDQLAEVSVGDND